MLIRRVRDDVIKEDANVTCVRRADEFAQIVFGAQVGIDRVIVRGIVAVITRRREDRREPERANTQVFEVVELRGDAFQIANAIAVRVVKTTRKNFVQDDVVEPRGRLDRRL